MADGDESPEPRRPSGPRAAVSRWVAVAVSSISGTTGTTPEHVIGLAQAFAIAVLAGFAFQLAQLPLPWLLGPLTISLLFAVSGRPLAQPNALLHPMRSLIGVAVGSSFTPALVDKAGGAAVSLVLMLPFAAAMTALGAIFLHRVAKFDRQTAFFGACPGGLADMVLFARDSGADLRRVTLVQAARVLTIVFALPFWLQFVDGKPLGGAMPAALHLWELTLGDALVIGLLAWGGWAIADRLGVTGSSIIGPMIVSGLAHGFGLTTAKVPIEFLIMAQVTIGIVIGAQFKGISLYEFVSVLSWGLALAVMLLVAAGAMALGVSRITGLDATSLLLSYAPGGQNEMAIIALILGVDVAIVALHHLLRVVFVVLTAQFIFQRNKDWRQS
jgi:membrane AbrB-like protein